MSAPGPLDWLAPLDGGQIPGGCEHCNAYQTPTLIAAGIYRLTVHHDDWCPTWRKIQRKQPRP